LQTVVVGKYTIVGHLEVSISVTIAVGEFAAHEVAHHLSEIFYTKIILHHTLDLRNLLHKSRRVTEAEAEMGSFTLSTSFLECDGRACIDNDDSFSVVVETELCSGVVITRDF